MVPLETDPTVELGLLLAEPLQELPRLSPCSLMEGLSLPDFNQLINDPIRHDVGWLAMPTKLPSDSPKFEGLACEDPSNHIRSFHMWCSSNSITDDSIRLRLFQRTLTGEASKWYVDQATSSHTTFSTIAQAFLSYF